MSFIQEFKEFAMKGNVIDMAVGVVIGGAFGQIVTSLANGTLITDLGVYGAPETYLIGRDGTIRYRHAGPLTPQDWATHFQPLLD